MGLLDMLDKAKSYLSRKQGTARDAVKHDRFDEAMVNQLMLDAPELRRISADLNVHYSFTDDLLRDTILQLWQSLPELRADAEMNPGHLLNLAVARDLKASPELQELRAYTEHDDYGAAMAVVGLTNEIRKYLEKNNEVQEEAEKAEQAHEEHNAATSGLQNAMGSAQAAQSAADEAAQAAQEAMNGYDGLGPLTEQQAAAQATAEQAQQILEQALADFQASLDAAEQADQACNAQQQVLDDLAKKAQHDLQAPIRAAIQQANEQLKAEAQLFSAWGVEDGELKQMSFEERRRLAAVLQRNRLNKFRQLIGRFRQFNAAQRTKKTEYGRDEFYDTTLSGDPELILASEFALMQARHRGLRMLTLLRFAEGQMTSRKFRGEEKIGKGAIIMCLDGSGSMEQADSLGFTREAWSKAVALAMLDTAQKDQRDFVVINFSSERQQKVWRFPKGNASIEEVMEFTEHFFNGGTNFEKPLTLATDILEEEFNATGKQKADIVFVTDDDAHVSPAWMEKYQARKKKLDFRIFGIAVGMLQPGSFLTALSDDVRAVQEYADPESVVDIMRSV